MSYRDSSYDEEEDYISNEDEEEEFEDEMEYEEEYSNYEIQEMEQHEVEQQDQQSFEPDIPSHCIPLAILEPLTTPPPPISAHPPNLVTNPISPGTNNDALIWGALFGPMVFEGFLGFERR